MHQQLRDIRLAIDPAGTTHQPDVTRQGDGHETGGPYGTPGVDRQAVRVAIASCRQCEEGGDCVGALMELFRYLPPEVKSIVELTNGPPVIKLICSVSNVSTRSLRSLVSG